MASRNQAAADARIVIRVDLVEDFELALRRFLDDGDVARAATARSLCHCRSTCDSSPMSCSEGRCTLTRSRGQRQQHRVGRERARTCPADRSRSSPVPQRPQWRELPGQCRNDPTGRCRRSTIDCPAWCLSMMPSTSGPMPNGGTESKLDRAQHPLLGSSLVERTPAPCRQPDRPRHAHGRCYVKSARTVQAPFSSQREHWPPWPERRSFTTSTPSSYRLRALSRPLTGCVRIARSALSCRRGARHSPTPVTRLQGFEN
jgi:hypothetical protein